jgi:cell division septum initiation protein DivIVA
MFRGYDPAAVDAYIEVLITKQQLLLDDVESRRAQLKESGDEAAALRIEVAILTDEVAVLTDTSPGPSWKCPTAYSWKRWGPDRRRVG